MPFAFADPVWLWLAPPVALVVVGAWLVASRALPRGRRIASLVIRLLLVACLVAILAGARLALPSDRLSVVFLVDGSASMVDATRGDLVDFARRSVREMPNGDTAGVVVFGANALVDRLPSGIDELGDPESVPVVGATDIGAAIRLAAAIFPAGTQRRLVLLSDGNDTAGAATQAVLGASSAGIRLDVLLPSGEAYGEALVDGIDAPDGARVGETIEVTVRLRSTIETAATLRLLADGATVATRELDLEPGSQSVTFTVRADEAGFHVFRAILEPADDHFAENNAAEAYTLVTGEPQVLVATDDPARAADLVEALTTARQQVTVVPSTGVPSSITALAGYDAVVLDDVPSDALGEAAMQSLQVYVRDLGRGLVMLGGRSSFGAGGYLDTPIEETLPVYMTVRDRDRNPDVALVAVVDKSGSMADCHCTGDQMGGQQQTRGFEKVDIAKEAILRAADTLGADRSAGRGGLRLRRALGGAHRAGQLRQPPGLARLRRRWRDEHLRRSQGRVRRPGGQPGLAASHHPHHRRLVAVRCLRRAHRRHEGGGHHPVHHRRRRRLVARAARHGRGGRRPLLRRLRREPHSGHLPQGDDPHCRRAARRGDLPADPVRPVGDPARAGRRAAAAAARATTRPRQRAAPPSHSSPPARTRCSRSGSTASAARWRGPPTRASSGRHPGSERPSSGPWPRSW